MLRLAGLVARGAGRLSRALGRGGGTTLPGVVLLRLRPNAIAELAGGLEHGVVLISATNGKTTTTRLVVAAAESLGRRVVTNAEGSNLERGIAAALLERRDANIAIFEVDEAALPTIARATKPRAVVLMNLFRDQLDRFGELDTLVDAWRVLLDDPAVVRDGCALVINADDPNLADLGRDAERAQVTWFGVDDISHGLADRAHAADATSCRRCGNPIEHDVVLLGHLGHWRCSNGDAERPAPDVRATSIQLSSAGQRTEVRVDDNAFAIESPLAGLHNAYNLTAAFATAHILADLAHGRANQTRAPASGAPESGARIANALGETGAAFGRGERIDVDGRSLNLLLAKNPTGVNQNIRTILADRPVHVLAILNDRTADGRDVSWIWDVDWEPLDGRLASLTLAGDRAWDLALRFKYAGFDMSALRVEPIVASALDHAITQVPTGETLHALPTYTAMLDLRSELTRRGHVSAYWLDGDRSGS